MPRPPHSRRAFLRLSGLGTVAGSAFFIAACGGEDTPPPAPDPGAGGNPADLRILNSALDLENTAVAAYAAAAVRLVGPAQAAAERFGEQEQEHADGLAQAIRDLGGAPNKPRSRAEYTRALDVAALRDQDEVLEFAKNLENDSIAAYIDALPKLSSSDLRGTTAAILTNEAEHLSVLLGALGEPDVPRAFVTGKARGA
ncbi:MAG: DUF4439 domain-containing protein [Thermoleophilaceae bacterium]|nr:DUF4439 domain-containing protein [Thermoleophilaceae bacterium]